jgi:hypothetical protein
MCAAYGASFAGKSAEARGDRRGADNAMAQLVIDAPYFEGRLTGTDTMITEVGSANLEGI